MSEEIHGSSSADNNKRERLKSLSLLDSHNFERLRYVVLPASIFILFIGGVLFLFVLITSLKTIWNALLVLVAGEPPLDIDLGKYRQCPDPVTMGLVVHFLEIISDTLKAVVFFIIGVGIYSIFIAPLNLARSMGVATFDDLEDRVIGVIVVVMSIEFLERFIQWQKPTEILQFAGALAVVAGALAVFVRFRCFVAQKQKTHIQTHSSLSAESKEDPENMK